MSRSLFARVALAVALLFVAGSIVDAQDRDRGDRDRGQGRRGGNFGRGGFGFGGRGGFTMNKLRLVGMEQIQTELKVTGDQKPKIEDVVAAYNDESRGGRGRGEGRGRGDFQRLSDEERAERDKQRQALVAKYEKKLDAVLEKAQVTRLNEIELQQKGTRALTEGPVAASLKLSDEQVGKLKAVFKTQDDERQKLFQSLRDGGGGREGFAEMQEKMQKMQKDADTKALAVLSEEQQKKFTEMKGKTLEIDFRRGGGFGRGRGGEGRGRGGEGRGGGGQRRRPPVDDA